MKKRILIMATIVVGLGLTACSVDTSGLEEAADDMKMELDESTDKADSNVAVPGATYQCPDDCENGPSYDLPGPCTGCGKEMEIL